MTIPHQSVKTIIGGFFLIVALVFIYRSFYGMRIPEEDLETGTQPQAPTGKETIHPAKTASATTSFVTGSGVNAKIKTP